jgi:hypothetical protein
MNVLKNLPFKFMLMTFLLGCQAKSVPENKPLEQIDSEINRLEANKVELLKNLSIPAKWVKVTMVDSVWQHLIPCKEEGELPSIELTIVHDEEALIFNWGTAGQWHLILDISEQNDSIVFKTAVPYDPDYPVLFVFKYLDKNKKIASWSVDNEYLSYFIPIADTVKFKRVEQQCD